MSGAPRAFVLGWPVEHSRSPKIHGHWLATLGLPGSYEKRAVPPSELEAFLARMGAEGFVGGNVTIPHKEAAAAACASLTPSARRLGSANTLWLADGALHGDSTDGEGFLAALDAEARGWRDRREHAVVLGAGGAARAIVDALHTAGFGRVTVVNRTPGRAEALVRDLGCGTSVGMEALPDLLADADLLVNTTPAGMAGAADLAIDLSPLPPHAVVNDIVYVPLVTPLLARARARGLRTVGGLGMLLHQAVPGFERWFGVRPQVTPDLRALVEADVAGSAG